MNKSLLSGVAPSRSSTKFGPMRITHLIKQFGNFPVDAEVYFEDLEGRLLRVEKLRYTTLKEQEAAGRDAKTPAVVVSPVKEFATLPW